MLKANNTVNDTAIQECKICLQANSTDKLPFIRICIRATKHFQIIYGDTMEPISLVSHPSKYKFVLVLIIIDATRAALAFLIQCKSDVPQCIDTFIKSMRNLVGSDEKFCFLRCDRGTKFTGQSTIDILDKYDAELQVACLGTSQYNGVPKRFNGILENKVRVMLFNSGLPQSYCDYTFTKTPYKSIRMKIPLFEILPSQSKCLEQIKRID